MKRSVKKFKHCKDCIYSSSILDYSCNVSEVLDPVSVDLHKIALCRLQNEKLTLPEILTKKSKYNI